MIEVDTQFIIRVFLGGRMNNKVKEEKRLSKYDYGHRKGYSAKTALLEKRLIFNCVKNRSCERACDIRS